mgnify:CR=1 FL=1
MYFIIGSPKSIESIKGQNLPDLDIRKIRESQKILVIDDNPSHYKDFLVEKYEFKITKIDDIQDISVVSEYGVILCDMEGVGKGIGGKSGGDVITEIRKRYPLKQIVAYTGHKFQASYNKYFTLADRVVEKDIELDEWVELLDGLAKELTDPIVQWKRTRNLLFEQGVATSIVVELEDSFVTSCFDKEKLNNLKGSRIVDKLSPVSKNIVQDLVTNLLVRLIIGGVS